MQYAVYTPTAIHDNLLTICSSYFCFNNLKKKYVFFQCILNKIYKGTEEIPGIHMI